MAIPGGVARGLEGGAVELYDERGRFTQRLAVHQSDVIDAVVSPDGRWAVTGDDSGRAMVWDINPGTGLWAPREELTGHSGGIKGVAIDRRGGTVVTVSTDGTAISWDVSPGAGFGAPLKGLGDRWISNTPGVVVPGELVVAPTRAAPRNGGQLGEHVSAAFLDPRTGEVVDEVEVGDTLQETSNGSSVAVSPDRDLVAVTHGEGTVVLDTATRKEVARIVLDDVAEFDGRHPDRVWSTVWTPDGDHLLLGADGKQMDPDDGGLAVVDTATWKAPAERVDIGGSAQSMEVSPDEQVIAVALTVPPVTRRPTRNRDSSWTRTRSSCGASWRWARAITRSTSPTRPTVRAWRWGPCRASCTCSMPAPGKVLHAPKKVHDDFVQQVEWLKDGRTSRLHRLRRSRLALRRRAWPGAREPAGLGGPLARLHVRALGVGHRGCRGCRRPAGPQLPAGPPAMARLRVPRGGSRPDAGRVEQLPTGPRVRTDVLRPRLTDGPSGHG